MKMKNSEFRLNRKALLGLMVLAAVGAAPVQAATITVDPAAVDAAVAGSNGCSLREAVLSINAGADFGDCVAVITEGYGTNDTITMPAGTYTLTEQGVDETVDTLVLPLAVTNVSNTAIGDLDITKSVRIIGAASATTIIQWDAAIPVANRDRIFHVNAATGIVNVVVQGVTLKEGSANQVDLGVGPVSGSGPLPTNYWLRRAGGALAVGPAAAVVLVDPNITGQANSEGRGGSNRPPSEGDTGATITLTLTDVIVDGNAAGGDGGGIYTAAAMTATNIIVRNNNSITNGGGIYNEGNTSLTASTVSGNIAEGGGGVFLTGSNTVTIAGVTMSSNRAVGGGAVSGRSGVIINMVNSTLSGNLGADVGAGFYHNGVASLRFVSIANNVAGADSEAAGAGINTFKSGSSVTTIKNVLLAGNKKGWVPVDYKTDAFPDTTLLTPSNCGTTGSGTPDITSNGYNLSSDTTCAAVLTQATDKNNIDPLIGDLAANGGPTLTHALLAGSPALSAGGAEADVTVDQRGVTREAPPDIGAFELANITPTPTPTPTTTSSGGGGGGGCAITTGKEPFDPVLPMLAVLGLIGVGVRRLRRY